MSPRLTAAQLLAGFDYAQPLAFEAYAPSAAAGAATHRFEGLLELNGEAHGGAFRSHIDRYGFAGDSDSPVRHLPEFAFELVQAGQALVPVRRGLVMTAHPQWEWLLEPGRVWREPGDGAYSRAALPFSLQERNANCTHNGVITFAFKRNCCLACRVPGQQRDLRLLQGRSLGLARRNVYTAPRCRSHRRHRGVPSRDRRANADEACRGDGNAVARRRPRKFRAPGRSQPRAPYDLGRDRRWRALRRRLPDASRRLPVLRRASTCHPIRSPNPSLRAPR